MHQFRAGMPSFAGRTALSTAVALLALQSCLAATLHEVQLGNDAYEYTRDGGRYPNHFDWAGPSCATRKHLIIATVGDRSNVEHSWLDDEARRSFDVLVLFYGHDARFTCSKCIGVMRHPGSKWQLIRKLSGLPVWQEIRQHYTHVMLPTEIDIMSTHTINLAFHVAETQGLSMSHLSACNHVHSPQYWPILRQKPGVLLQHTTFVSIEAPIFTMAALEKHILPNLWFARVGWGLDHLWSMLLDYDPKLIGIIHAGCFFRLGSKIEIDDGSTHPEGWSGEKEEAYVRQHWNTTAAEISAFREKGFPGTHTTFVWKTVPIPKEGLDMPFPPLCPSSWQTEVTSSSSLLSAAGAKASSPRPQGDSLSFLIMLQALLALTFIWIQAPRAQLWLQSIVSSARSRVPGRRK